MTNSEISSRFKLTAKLLELHGEHPFKIRSYQNIRETISSLSIQLSTMPEADIESLDGIGKNMSANIRDLLATGTFDGLEKLLSVTPNGVIEMLNISGFGPKKIKALWKEIGAESLEDIEQLCRVGQVASLKGFGEKSQHSLLNAVRFVIDNRGKTKYAVVDSILDDLVAQVQILDGVEECMETGDYRRRLEVISEVELLVTTNNIERCRVSISSLETLNPNEKKSGPLTWVGDHDTLPVPVKIRFCLPDDKFSVLIETTGSVAHLNCSLPDGAKLISKLSGDITSERQFYENIGLTYIVPEMREGRAEISKAVSGQLPELVELSDLKGILHNHSTYSDGKNTLREMAEACRNLGYQYLGISDHSQTAVYANGLQAFSVKKQQEEIALLNKELFPFKIFSGIESDILNDGELDYPDEILASFDFVIASIHSGLSMDMNKATNRLITAIRNPYTTILGHMTGRLILERKGYPVDHKAVIEACAEENVVIEINSSPYRLDMDWRWVDYAMERGVMLSINPDAHRVEGYSDMKYGILVGRKGGLTKKMTLNAMNEVELSDYFKRRLQKIVQ